jgi:hypothetical protein
LNDRRAGGTGDAKEGILPLTYGGGRGFSRTETTDTKGTQAMGKKRPQESIIHDIKHLPAGFVPMGQLANESGATPLYGFIDRAFHRGELRQGRFKCRGKVFIHEDDLSLCKSAFESQRDADGSDASEEFSRENTAPEGQQFECMYGYLDSLRLIEQRLLRIANAAESIATAVESIAAQPKTPPQQGLAHEMSGYGFHS